MAVIVLLTVMMAQLSLQVVHSLPSHYFNLLPISDMSDIDRDGIPDYIDDSDGDGIPDQDDPTPYKADLEEVMTVRGRFKKH